MKAILGILGATGVGKTAVSVEIAQKLGCSYVISADSMQIYKGMDVGTAKITEEEAKELNKTIFLCLEKVSKSNPLFISFIVKNSLNQ